MSTLASDTAVAGPAVTPVAPRSTLSATKSSSAAVVCISTVNPVAAVAAASAICPWVCTPAKPIPTVAAVSAYATPAAIAIAGSTIPACSSNLRLRARNAIDYVIASSAAVSAVSAVSAAARSPCVPI
ncbi:hypothetical protein [Mycolicibacter senuensis]|uniref:hypothetical protein n=1 Tax=Mycolicibacter senuensis TaxID=386913 RepID=UPI001402F63A|nr:hypothetical protein [Mycolicibacter senuensis]